MNGTETAIMNVMGQTFIMDPGAWWDAHVLPAIRGEGEGAGDTSYQCSSCAAILIETVVADKFIGTFKCPQCRSFSEYRPYDPIWVEPTRTTN